VNNNHQSQKSKKEKYVEKEETPLRKKRKLTQSQLTTPASSYSSKNILDFELVLPTSTRKQQ
jgi:hypothetical protein